jgi:hypothetical protein
MVEMISAGRTGLDDSIMVVDFRVERRELWWGVACGARLKLDIATVEMMVTMAEVVILMLRTLWLN